MNAKQRRKARRASMLQAALEVPGQFQLQGDCGELEITAGEGKGLKKFRMVAYRGGPMRLSNFSVPVVVDLDSAKALRQDSPALVGHDPDRIVGHTTKIKVNSPEIHVEGILSGVGPEAERISAMAANGFPWQVSIGANAGEMEFVDRGERATVNGKRHEGPLYIARNAVLREFSFLSLGADGGTSATVAAAYAKEHPMFEKWLKARGIDVATLTAEQKTLMQGVYDAEVKLLGAMGPDGKPCKAADDEPDEDDDEKGKGGKPPTNANALTDFKAQMDAEIQRMRSSFTAEMDKGRKEQDRQTKLASLLAAHQDTTVEHEGKQVPILAHAIAEGWDSDRTELQLRRLADIRGSRLSGPHFHFAQKPILNEAVLEAAVFDALPQFKLFDSDFYKVGENGQRRCSVREEKRITADLNARYTDQVRQAAHDHYPNGIGLQQLLTTLARANGYKGPETFNTPNGWGSVADYLSIRADAPSSVSTPATLANVQNKFMLQGYMFTEQAFMEICQVLPVKDLKPTKSVQLFGDFVFKPLNPGGEIQHASVGDNPYANQAKLQARMITLELQYLINDDLGMFGQVPMMLGRGWGLRVNDLVWTAMLAPGTDDGGSTNFFAVTHTIAGQSGNANYNSGAGSTLTSAGLQAAKLLLDRQVDPAGKKLGMDAEILLYPPELDVAAIELMNAQFIVMAGLASTASASKQPNTNIWKGRFRPVMSRYLSDSAFTGYSLTGWYLMVSPTVLPTIQIAALNGQMAPTIQTAGQDWNFNMLGISMRGWGGVGVNMQNFRGAVLSAGA